MIVDRIAKMSTTANRFVDTFEIFEVPYEIGEKREACPWTFNTSDKTTPKQEDYDNDCIPSAFLRPPYTRTCYFHGRAAAFFVKCDNFDELGSEIRGIIGEQLSCEFQIRIGYGEFKKSDYAILSITVGDDGTFVTVFFVGIETYYREVYNESINKTIHLLVEGSFFGFEGDFISHMVKKEFGLVCESRYFNTDSSTHKKDYDLFTDAALANFFTGNALLNCSNVKTEKVEHNPKIQRTRKRSGSLPLYRYHILKIKRSSRTRSDNSNGKGASTAIHMVRGHFKHYNDESPLLGKHVGTYWWQPHIAGTAARVIDKDYKLEAAE